jgi:folate-dependent phosphoribosylglycinamide formyltransferase PurN
MTAPDASARIALITSSPGLVEPFLRATERRQRTGIEVVLVVRVRPSMRLVDRVRDLRRVLRRQARINRTSPLLQAVHYFTYRRLSGWARRSIPASAEQALGNGRSVVEVESANDPAAVAALQDSGAALGVVVGADVLSRATLEALGLPLYNLHMSDPVFVRGMPMFFWEIHGDRDSICMTLHELVADLDAGPVLAQRSSPVVWGPTLAETLRRTGAAAADEVARLLDDGIAGILDGTLQPRRVARGPLRTTPTVRQSLRAHRICRQRFAETVARTASRRG